MEVERRPSPESKEAPRQRGWLFPPGLFALVLGLFLATPVFLAPTDPPYAWDPFRWWIQGLLAAGLVLLGASWIVGAVSRLRRVPRTAWLGGGMCLGVSAFLVGTGAFGALALTAGPAPWWPHTLGYLVLGVGALDLALLAFFSFTRMWPIWPDSGEGRLARLAVLALPVWIVVSVFFLTIGLPPDRARGAKVRCINNVRQICTILSERSRAHGWPDRGGKAFVLSLVEDGVIDPMDPRNLEIFVCPVCTDRLQALKRFPPDRTEEVMTTYAGLRNDEEAYRLGPDAVARGVGPIVACLEHAEGVVVGYADGSARFIEWERLGLEARDPRVVGEASKSPRLTALSDE